MKIKKISRNYGVSFDATYMVESQGSAGNRSKDNYSYYKSYAQQDNSVGRTNSRTLLGLNNLSIDVRDGANYLSGGTSNYTSNNRNFEYNIETTASIKNTTANYVDYTYSDSNLGSYRGDQWKEPSYTANLTHQEI